MLPTLHFSILHCFIFCQSQYKMEKKWLYILWTHAMTYSWAHSSHRIVRKQSTKRFCVEMNSVAILRIFHEQMQHKVLYRANVKLNITNIEKKKSKINTKQCVTAIQSWKCYFKVKYTFLKRGRFLLICIKCAEKLKAFTSHFKPFENHKEACTLESQERVLVGKMARSAI